MKNVLLSLCCLLLLEEAKAVSKTQKCKNNGNDNMCVEQDDADEVPFCSEDECGTN